MKKSKKWVDMDADELTKESKTFRFFSTFCLIMTSVSFIITWCRLMFFDRFNYFSAFCTIIFLLLALYSLNINLHLNTLKVFLNKNLEDR